MEKRKKDDVDIVSVPITRVVQVAFGDDFPLWKIHALKLLDSEKNLPSDLQAKMLDFCIQQSFNDWSLDDFSIAEICVMMTAKAPAKAHEWLNSFVLDGLVIADAEDDIDPDFHFGLALGIFQSGLWLDNHWQNHSLKFHKVLPQLVTRLITHSCPAMEQPESIDSKNMLTMSANRKRLEHYSKLDGILSQSIKAYFRPKINSEKYKKARQKNLCMVHQNMVDWNKTDIRLMFLGKKILQQINFAFAGSMDPLTHAVALAGCSA